MLFVSLEVRDMNRPITGTEKKTVRIHIALEPAELAAIDDYRFQARESSRSEAIRALIALGLKAVSAQK